MVSDPVDLEVPELGYLSISIYVPNKTAVPTWHGTGLHTTFISGPGDFTATADMAQATTQTSWFWLAGLDVTAPPGTGAIVAFGDSITDGATVGTNTNDRWPNVLGNRLAALPRRTLSVVDEGIGVQYFDKKGKLFNKVTQTSDSVPEMPAGK